MSEDRFHEEFAHELAGREAPPIGSLVEDALAHGRRMHRRRRFGGSAAAAAGFALVAAIPFVLGPRSGPGSGPGTVTAIDASAFTGTLWHPATAPPAQVRVADPVSTDWQAGVQLLRSLLPASDSELYSGDAPTAALHALDSRVTYTDATGRDLMVGFLGPRGANGTCGDVPARGSGEGPVVKSCTLTAFPDATVRVQRDVTWSRGKILWADYNVEIDRTNGFRLWITENAAGPDAMLDPEALYRIISDPHWAWTMERGFVSQANQQIQNTFAEHTPSMGTT